MAADTNICENQSVTLDPGVAGGSYQWSNNSSAQTINVNQSGTYTVTVTNADGCTSTDEQIVNIEKLLPAPIVNCNTDAAKGFVYTWSSVTGATTYVINYNGTPQNIGTDTLYSNAVAATSFSVQAVGTYCKEGAASLPIPCEIVIPNIVTPNGDGKNDLFVIQNLQQYENPNLQLFNRWGNIILNSSNYDNKFDFKDYADGVYFYILTIPNAEPSEYKGSVTVIK